MHTRRSLQPSLFLVVPAALALGWAATVAADDDQRFPATGQTTSYRPGDDGDIQAGATPRYRDQRNGTIKDRNTRLVWERAMTALSTTRTLPTRGMTPSRAH